MAYRSNKKLKNELKPQNVYFIGIGGIGMSALLGILKISETSFMIKPLRL
jgi:UDP-N-acetylmuramate-alanine ligase